MSSAAQPSGFELAVAEGLLSALPQSHLALETARKFLEDDGLTLEEAEARLRELVAAPRPCETCGEELLEAKAACPNCGHVAEADTVADYPQQQYPKPKRKRKRRKPEPEQLDEATVINNALVGGSVTGTPTAWGGANPAAVGATLPLEAYPGVTTPPNLREAEGWESCLNCVFFFKGCNLYGVDRPPANVVHALPYPVDPTDVCDSHASLTPQVDRVEEARAQLAEALAAGDNEKVVRLRARVQALEEGLFNKLLHPRAAKGRVGGGEFIKKIGGLQPGQSVKVGNVTIKHKPGKGAGASLTGRQTAPHYVVEGPGNEYGSHHVVHTAAEAAALAEKVQEKRKKKRRATGRAQTVRPRVALQEVSSRAYPGLDRSPKENWVDKAGGLPSYIERIAKHLHYEKGFTISHAIATGVNTVKKWCAGGKGNTTAATKAKACAAVAEWEAKKAKGKAKKLAEAVELEARRDGSWRYPSLEQAEAILEGAEAMDDIYPPLGAETSLPRYVNRVAAHLHARGKPIGEAVAIAYAAARSVGDGESGAETLREEARLAADEYEARAEAGWWALELVESVEWTTREGQRLGGPTPPSEGFIRKLHTEIAQADGPRWWEGMSAGDERDLEEFSLVRAIQKGASGRIVSKEFAKKGMNSKTIAPDWFSAGEKWSDAAGPRRRHPHVPKAPSARKRGAAGSALFDPLKHPRASKGRTGGGRFVDVLGKLSVDAKAGRATPPVEGLPYRVGGGLRIDPKALEGIIGDALKVGNEKAVDNYIAKINEKWGGPWDTIRPELVKLVAEVRARRAGAAASHGEDHGRATPAIPSFDDIGPGDRVTIRTPHGQERTGRAVMLGPAGWVLNLGGAHGTPGIASESNIVKVKKARTPGPTIPGGRENEPLDDSWKGFVAQMNGERAGRANLGIAGSPGRGPSGKLRNFKAMNEGKLAGVIEQLADYGTDTEALKAAIAAAHEKGMSIPSLDDLETPAAPAPAAAAPGGELSIDHAIGSVLQSHGDDLKDWHLSGPAPVNGQKRWTLDIELKNGDKHSILIGEDGTVELAPPVSAVSVVSSGSVQPVTEAQKSKAKAAVVEIMDAQPAPKPHAQHSAGAQKAATADVYDLQPTGEEESPYHMADGTYFKGGDGKTYQKLENGPKLMMSKKGPIAGVRIRNVTLGTEKLSPAFALSSHYYEILAPGGNGYQGDIADTPTPDEPTGDVYELLKKSIGGAPSPTVFGSGAGTTPVGHLSADQLSGKNVVITGAIPGMTRKEAGQSLAAVGANLQSSVTKTTDYLITGKNVGATKINAAQKKGVTVVGVDAVMHLLEAAVVDDHARLAWTEFELAEATTTAETMRLRARRDALRRRLDEAVLTSKTRAKLPSSAFALPGGRYPIHDEAHARNALSRVAQHGTPEEQKKVRAAVKRRYPNIGGS